MRSSIRIIAWSCIAAVLLSSGWAADPATPPASPSAAAPTAADIAKLKAQLDLQQKEIEQLLAALAAERKMLEQAGLAAPAATAAPGVTSINVQAQIEHATPPDRLMASTAPMLAPPASATAASPTPKFSPPAPQAPAAEGTSPLQLRIGDTTILPIGFMDFTAIWKDKNAGGSLGSNFGSIPYNNAATAKLSEFKFSPQNSRIGFRVDGNWKDTHFTAYNENDFVGTSGSNAITVTNGAFVPRLRLFWVDVRKGSWEIMGGQSWSMLTPSRKGISPLPADIFYSQTTDINYMIGLPWTRQPGLRLVYHPNNQVAFGVSFENPDAYIGGSGGGPSITLPTAFAGFANVQLDNAGAIQTTPNLHPDIIAKLAFDPMSRVHFEFAGIERTFKTWNTTTGQPASGKYFTSEGVGGSFNANVEVAKNFRLLTNNIYGQGIGRYFFGNAPDLIVRSDASISPIHSGGFVEGFEATVRNTLLYGYYGALYIGRDVALDANGTSLIGYGYRGAANSQNKTVQEVTFGFNQTIWKDAKYGAINLMGQYEYLLRNPWYIAVNSPKNTHDNTIYMNLRYTIPGAPPPVK